MEIIQMTASELSSVETSGTSLKSLKAKDLRNGIYTVIELKDVNVQTKDEVIASISEYYGETPKWTENLPDSNISGYLRLKTSDGVAIGVYMNNPLFNLMIEGKALEVKKKSNKVAVSLTGKPFKI